MCPVTISPWKKQAPAVAYPEVVNNTAPLQSLTTMRRNDSPKELPRVKERPGPDQWDEDEPVTLAEGAALFTYGLINERGLRTAIDNGELEFSKPLGRIYTTKRAIRALFRTAIKLPDKNSKTIVDREGAEAPHETIARGVLEKLDSANAARSRRAPAVTPDHTTLTH